MFAKVRQLGDFKLFSRWRIGEKLRHTPMFNVSPNLRRGCRKGNLNPSIEADDDSKTSDEWSYFTVRKYVAGVGTRVYCEEVYTVIERLVRVDRQSENLTDIGNRMIE